MSKTRDLKPKDYERIGRDFEQIYLSGAKNKLRLAAYGLLKGMMFGLGSAIGATVIFALLLWVLGVFDNLPLIGEWLDSLQSSFDEASQF